MNRLKELRLSKGLNMKETAAALGLPYTTYVNYEKSLREPNSETLIDLAHFYNTTIDYILGKTDDPINYECDPVLDEIPSSIYHHLYEIYNGNRRQIRKAWLEMDKSTAEQAALDSYLESQKTNPKQDPTQHRLQIAARHLEELPEDIREKMLSSFEESIDMYLDVLKKKKDSK